MTKITNNQLLSLQFGGRDGGIYKAASTAVEDAVIHMIELLADDTTFTVLAAEDQDGTVRNMLTANGYATIALAKTVKIYAPFGGKITDFTADKPVRYFRLPTSNRSQND